MADAEEKLVRDARNQHASTAWWAHVGNFPFNTGIALFEGWASTVGAAASSTDSGLVVGEAVIFSQPTQKSTIWRPTTEGT